MAKKKITIAAGANPFDKSLTAAEQMFAQPVAEEIKDEFPEASTNVETESNSVGYIGEVDSVEQQNQHIQQAPKTKKRTFVGKQHIHLILPDRQADIIKQLAKMTGISVNQFMSQAIDILYEERWKPVVEVLEQNRHKLGLDRKTDKNLFN